MSIDNLEREHEREHDQADTEPNNTSKEEEQEHPSLIQQDPVDYSDPDTRSTSSSSRLFTPSVPLRLSEYNAVTGFYQSRLLLMQQRACKQIAKAWIKAIHPHKQTHYPYRGGDGTAPPWWPAGVLHKEPDHLMKCRRMVLLLTILRLEWVSIDALEKATDELDAPVFRQRRGLLKEIYVVALEERRLWADVLGENRVIFVAAEPARLIEDPAEGDERAD